MGGCVLHPGRPPRIIRRRNTPFGAFMSNPLPRRSSRDKFRAIVVWAMVPLMFGGARPVTGCICADGHFETACPSFGVLGVKATRPGACSACGGGIRTCCQGSGCCGRRSRAPLSESGSAVAGCRCCTPVLAAPSPALGSPVHRSDLAIPVAVVFDLDVPHSFVEGVTGAYAPIAQAKPSDRVVCLRRLLI